MSFPGFPTLLHEVEAYRRYDSISDRSVFGWECLDCNETDEDPLWTAADAIREASTHGRVVDPVAYYPYVCGEPECGPPANLLSIAEMRFHWKSHRTGTSTEAPHDLTV